MQKDSLQRFIFEHADVRGAIVSLEKSYTDMLENQSYDEGKQQLLGEFAAATVLLAGHLKFQGALSLQIRGGADIDLVVAECNENLEYRGVVSSDKMLHGYYFEQAFAGATLAITMLPKQGQQYQGIVPLQNNSLAGCLADYFEHSEQLPTWFYFAASAQRITGVMLQAMPAQICLDPEESKENWSRLVHLASTLTQQEMTTLDHEQILYRLYHEENVRLFEAEAVKYQCTCSIERMERGLLTLGDKELRQLLEDQDEIKTQCHFCAKEYVFLKPDIIGLIQGAGTQNSH